MLHYKTVCTLLQPKTFLSGFPFFLFLFALPHKKRTEGVDRLFIFTEALVLHIKYFEYCKTKKLINFSSVKTGHSSVKMFTFLIFEAFLTKYDFGTYPSTFFCKTASRWQLKPT